jgi:hypothetical protein
VRAVSTKPLRGFASPPPFLQSACGYSEKWLRISLRATPRDPTERTMRNATTKTSARRHIGNPHSCHE